MNISQLFQPYLPILRTRSVLYFLHTTTPLPITSGVSSLSTKSFMRINFTLLAMATIHSCDCGGWYQFHQHTLPLHRSFPVRPMRTLRGLSSPFVVEVSGSSEISGESSQLTSSPYLRNLLLHFHSDIYPSDFETRCHSIPGRLFTETNLTVCVHL